MATTIYMCGHGKWAPKDGFVELPVGVTMTFIADVAKVLYTDDMFKVCEGTYKGEPARVIGEGESRQCPNMTWTADASDKITECDKRIKNNPSGGVVLFPNHINNYLDNTNSISLADFFAKYWPTAQKMIGSQANLVWACCGYLALKPSKLGADIGMNAAQTAGQYDHIDYTAHDPILTGKVTKIA